jgi:SNF2 family DNA or RNA helicase
MEDEGVTPLNELFPGLIMRKRKTDPDVIDQFPKKMEEDPTVVELHERHRHLLRLVAELLTEVNGEDAVKVGLGMLRQMAGHPLAVLRSNTTFARRVVREVGEAGLRATPSAKTEAMLDWALRMGTDQGVLFTFYGPSILPHLAEAMTKAGFSVAVHNGEMGLRAKADAKESYVRGDKQFFLSSDAGCRGLNLGMGAGLLHYEPSGVWAIHEQRSDRIHRIDSIHESVSIQMLVAKDSPDESALATQIQRQEYHELVFDPDTVSDPALDVLTAADRRALLARIRRR